MTAYYPNLQFVLPIAAFIGYVTWSLTRALLYPRKAGVRQFDHPQRRRFEEQKGSRRFNVL